MGRLQVPQQRAPNAPHSGGRGSIPSGRPGPRGAGSRPGKAPGPRETPPTFREVTSRPRTPCAPGRLPQPSPRCPIPPRPRDTPPVPLRPGPASGHPAPTPSGRPAPRCGPDRPDPLQSRLPAPRPPQRRQPAPRPPASRTPPCPSVAGASGLRASVALHPAPASHSPRPAPSSEGRPVRHPQPPAPSPSGPHRVPKPRAGVHTPQPGPAASTASPGDASLPQPGTRRDRRARIPTPGLFLGARPGETGTRSCPRACALRRRPRCPSASLAFAFLSPGCAARFSPEPSLGTCSLSSGGPRVLGRGVALARAEGGGPRGSERHSARTGGRTMFFRVG